VLGWRSSAPERHQRLIPAEAQNSGAGQESDYPQSIANNNKALSTSF